MQNLSLESLSTLQFKQFRQKHPYPCSTDRKLIFPFDFSTTRYHSESYKTVLSGGKVNDYDILLFFERLYKEVPMLSRFSPDILQS
jgi:hypothetical protein